MAWRRAAPLNEGLPDPCAFYHVHSFAPRPADAERRARHAPTTASEFVSAVGAAAAVRRAVPPREVRARTGCALLAELRAQLRATCPHDPPARRSTSAAAGRCGCARATSTTRRSTPTTRSRRRARWVEAGARFLHVVDLDGAREGEPAEPRPPASGSRASWTCRSSTAAACARSPSVARALAAGADARGARHGRATPTWSSSTQVLERWGRARGRGRRRARRPRVGVRLDEGDPDAAART